LQSEQVEFPPEFLRNARRFQYYQLWRTPLSFADFIAPHPTTPGYVTWQEFPMEALHTEQANTLRVIRSGILEGTPFLATDC